MTSKITSVRRAIPLIMLALATGLAQAQPSRERAGDRVGSPRGGEHYDARFSHNHYYSNRGVVVRNVPGGGSWVAARAGGRYYYSGGVWYAARGPEFIVVGPPIGVFVPVLPPFYTTVWVGGMPYYYANDAYYVWRGDQSGYEVVDPPGGDQGTTTTQPPPSDDFYIYPQSGQTDEQQSNDKFECHKWASSQSGFDPTQSLGGVSPDQVAASRANYQRAMRACLEGRGYSVR
ncbi:MAG: hypothetical protein JOZ89_03800 [Gammaproteobacteria bacterium]|nr:hypothetical protein [Gammaproteobacteria bacterium]